MVKRLDREIFIKVCAYILLGLAFLILIAGGVGSVSVWIFLPSSVVLRKILVSALLLFSGILSFFVLLGFYEFLMEFLSVEKEVEEIEEKIEEKE